MLESGFPSLGNHTNETIKRERKLLVEKDCISSSSLCLHTYHHLFLITNPNVQLEIILIVSVRDIDIPPPQNVTSGSGSCLVLVD